MAFATDTPKLAASPQLGYDEGPTEPERGDDRRQEGGYRTEGAVGSEVYNPGGVDLERSSDETDGSPLQGNSYSPVFEGHQDVRCTSTESELLITRQVPRE